MSTSLVPVKWRRIFVLAYLLSWVALPLAALAWLAKTIPLYDAVMLPLASVLTAVLAGGVVAACVAVRNARPPWIEPPLPTLVRVGNWIPQLGTVLVGVTYSGSNTETHDGHAFACWKAKNTPHMLVCGPSGSGKTSVMRWFILALLQAGYDLVIIDGKGAGACGADFAHLDQVLMVAEDPGDWLEATYLVRDEMRQRYQALRAWRYRVGDEPPPVRPVALVVDELEDVCTIAQDKFTNALFEVTRMGREAGGRVLASILRPDTSTIPGKVRDSFTGRVFVGSLSNTSAMMMFDDQSVSAQKAAADAADIPGRGVALLGGRIYPIQVPLVPDDHGELAELLPKKAEV